MTALSITSPQSSVSFEIPQETVEKAKAFVIENREFIQNIQYRLKDNNYEFYAGRQCTVFSHSDFPGLIFKIMGHKAAIDTINGIDNARRVFAENQFRYCHAPQAKITELSDFDTLVLMEKATGIIDLNIAKEEMEQEFEKIDIDTVISEKWEQMTKEVAEATALIGYWDAQRKNFVWDSEKGWSFIDFENTEPTRARIEDGLNHLVQIFPLQFIDQIYEVARRNFVTLRKSIDEAKKFRKDQFEFSRKLSGRNNDKGVPRVFNKEAWDPSSWERKILNQFDLRRKRGLHSPQNHTMLSWQPFSSTILDLGLSFNKDAQGNLINQFEKKGKPVYLRERAAFERALEQLKNADIVFDWRINESREKDYLVNYNIYF